MNLRFLISGASINDLSSPNQGLCGVRIKFEHKFIGDVTMELISPSGQRVRLLGPLGNSGRTDFTKWFISFVPCSATAVPDLGFKRKWDNLQSWGILGKFYNGTYYANMGCLEDFNMGPVNGTWTLSVSDAEKFYEGKIESFCLLFCDQTGINCQDCSPNGGFFTETNKDFCLNDPALLLTDQLEFPTFTPDTSKYGYVYLITRNDTLLAYKSQLDLRSFPVGNYEICGLSFLRADSSLLPPPGYLLSELKRELITGNLVICGEFSKNCLSVNIHPVYSGLSQNVRLCKGDSLVIDGEVYNQIGIYVLNLKSVNQCDSIVSLNLDMVDLKIQGKPLDTIDCSMPVVSIDISSSVLTSRSKILWSTMDGQIIDLSDSLSVKVNKEGSYTVIVQDGTCYDSAVFRVIKNEAIPELTVSADTINCVRKFSTLRATTNAKNPKFNWSDGVNLLGNADSLVVLQAGLYYITITDGNGCSNYAAMEVIIDTVPAFLELNAGILTCKDSLAKLEFNADKAALSLEWISASGYVSSMDSIFTRDKGFYTLKFTALNGCVSVDSVEVVSEISVPEYFFTLDTLNCSNNLQFQLQDRTSSMVDSIIFKGPGGFYANGLHPILSRPGMYRVRLTDVNACVLDTNFIVVADTLAPSFKLYSDSLNCVNDSVQLSVFHFQDSLGYEYHWTGPVGFDRNDKTPFTRQQGLYSLRVKGPNGCSREDTIRVFQDDSKPDIEISSSGDLSCLNKQVQLTGSSQDAVRFNWFGPSNFRSSQKDPIVFLEGLYKLVVTSANGCTSERFVDVIRDTLSPIKNVVYDSINCFKDSAVLQFNSQHNFDSLIWTGPGSFVSNNESIIVYQAGIYRLFVKGTNGCVDSSLVHVVEDTLKPSFQLKADTLDCKNIQGSILLITNDTAIEYEWLLPSGNTIRSQNLSVATPGIYKITARSKNGCQHIDSIEVFDFSNRPTFKFLKDTITCAEPMPGIGVNTTEQGLKFSWKGPNGFVSVDSFFHTGIPGWYTVTVTNSFNCQSFDSVYVPEFTSKPSIAFSSPFFDCRNKDSAFLSATWIDTLIQFEWIYPSGQISNQKFIAVTQTGKYYFNALDGNGCRSHDSLTVQFDTSKPLIIQMFADKLNCVRDSVLPLVEWSPVQSSILWSGPGLMPTIQPNPVLRIPGLYLLKITGPNFCVLDTFLRIDIDTAKPNIRLKADTITCENSRVQLTLNSPDSLSIVIWQGPGGEIYADKEPFVIDTGWYTVVVQALNGCFNTDKIKVLSDIMPPDLLLQDLVIPCDKDSIYLTAIIADPLASYNWFGPNQFFSNLSQPLIADTGYYKLILIGKNKCVSSDSLHVAYKKDLPFLFATSDTITCKSAMANLNGFCDLKNCKFLWKGPSLADSLNLNISVSIPGNYTFSVRDSFGCTKDTILEVHFDTLKPSVFIQALDSFICSQNIVRLTYLTPLSEYKVKWSSSDGTIIGLDSRDTVAVNKVGNYRLTILNSVNGCSDTLSYFLDTIVQDIGPVHVQVDQPHCFNSKDGRIVIDQIEGAYGPFRISLNGKEIQTSQVADQLEHGAYHVEVTDRFGCKLDTIIDLYNPSELFLDVGRDTVLKLGDRLIISPQSNANKTSLRSIIWTPDSWLDCPACFEVESRPESTIQYVLQIVDENGCVAIDSILISLILAPDIFIPNVISPNQDDINDRLTIYAGPEVQSILQFSIYDRWGNRVYHIDKIDPKSHPLLWDGQWNGQLLNPGVFVYRIEAQLVNGGIFRKTGDITLLR